MIAIIVILIVVAATSGVIGYTLGFDARRAKELELDHFRKAYDEACKDAKFWRQLYLRSNEGQQDTDM